jgi:hydrogenase-4 component E
VRTIGDLLDALLVIVLALNLVALGTSRLHALIRAAALQGALLGGVPLLAHAHLTTAAVLASAAAIVLKGVVIPAIMRRALRDAQIKREVEPLIGMLPSIVLGAVAVAGALALSDRLPLAGPARGSLIVPASIATSLSGFLLLTTRFKALSQVVGYLVLENGIFLFGMLLIDAMPLVVEMGALLDLVVGIFVISIIVNHIHRAFSSMDTRHLATLRE